MGTKERTHPPSAPSGPVADLSRMRSLPASVTSRAPTAPIAIDSRFVTLAQLAMMLAWTSAN